MNQTIKKLLTEKPGIKEEIVKILRYLIIGVLTTVVNTGVYYVLIEFLNVDYIVANAIAWVVAVLFAFPVNKCFVYQSSTRGIGKIFKEFATFTSSRIMTGILETGILYVLVSAVGFSEMIGKFASIVFSMAANYLLGRILVFKQ